jgi:hypothetical protein
VLQFGWFENETVKQLLCWDMKAKQLQDKYFNTHTYVHLSEHRSKC